MTRWNILDDDQVLADKFNHQVPGPRIELTAGDLVRNIVTNNLPESTTVHWHRLNLPNEMDGPAEITQYPIQLRESYIYEFKVTSTNLLCRKPAHTFITSTNTQTASKPWGFMAH